MATDGQPPVEAGGMGPLLRMSQVLEGLQEKRGGYAALEKDMREMFGDKPKAGAPRHVERRKLKRIVKNDPGISLSLGELRGLDAFLESAGHGLAYNPLFAKPELLRSLARSGRISFLLGSKEDENDKLRVNISHWDLLALNRIQSRVLSLSENVRIDIREVPMYAELDHAQEALLGDEYLVLDSNQGPSLVCFASSLGNQMAEWMLCRMAGDARINEFCPREAGDSRRLAFEFVWPDRDFVLPSAFHLDREKACKANAEVKAALSNGGACLRHRDGYLIDDLAQHKDKGCTYSVCCAQRREGGHIWLLVAGLTAPGTFAAAKWASRMPTDLGLESSRQSDVFWNVIRVQGVRVEEGRRPTYRLGETELVDQGEGLFLNG